MSAYKERVIKSIILFSFIFSAILLWSAFSSVSAVASSGRHAISAPIETVAGK